MQSVGERAASSEPQVSVGPRQPQGEAEHGVCSIEAACGSRAHTPSTTPSHPHPTLWLLAISHSRGLVHALYGLVHALYGLVHALYIERPYMGAGACLYGLVHAL